MLEQLYALCTLVFKNTLGTAYIMFLVELSVRNLFTADNILLVEESVPLVTISINTFLV
jgi:hypothetical protein